MFHAISHILKINVMNDTFHSTKCLIHAMVANENHTTEALKITHGNPGVRGRQVGKTLLYRFIPIKTIGFKNNIEYGYKWVLLDFFFD